MHSIHQIHWHSQGFGVTQAVCDSHPRVVGKPGLLLVGHGTRDPRGVAELLALAKLVDKKLPSVVVEAGFLELAEPTINDAIASVAARDVDSLIGVPILLFAAGHAKQDIPRAIDEALRGQREIPYAQASHLGTHPQLVALSARRYQETTARLAPLPADDTLLLLIGRGSRDQDATAEMLQFSHLRQRHCDLAHVTTAFYAMAEPGLEATIQSLQNKPYRRIVVQPHLLFCGQILDQIAALVDEANRHSNDQEWVLCEHLGPSSWLADILVERFMQTLAR